MTSEVRYASGEVPQVGDEVRCADEEIGEYYFAPFVVAKIGPHEEAKFLEIEGDVLHDSDGSWVEAKDCALNCPRFDLSALDTAGVFHRSQQPAPVETGDAPSQPADVPQWCRDAANDWCALVESRCTARISMDQFRDIIARHAGAAPEVERLKEEIENERRACDMHRELNRRAAEALGKPFCGEGSSWHDIPECITTLRERLAAAEEERDEPKASFDLEDDGTPEYGTPAYELFDKAITWTVHQLKNVLGVKEWSTSGGGTDTLDGDLRMELNDLLKAAGRDDDSMEALRAELARAKDALIHIGSFFGCSAHLPWFSDDACDEVSAIIDAYGGEKRYDPAFYETYCAQVIADIVTGALSASAGGEGAEKDGAK